MERVKVSSSSIASIGYDPASSTLEVQFNHGRVFEYFDVPADEHDGLMGASSHGTYFNHNIKDCYSYARV